MSIVVIIGPSGAGKSTVARIMQEKYGYHLQRTVTTRPQRNSYDTDHIFVNEETYETMQSSGAFLGILPTFGYNYGLPKFDVSSRTLLLLRAPAIEKFITQFKDALIVEIDAPFETLKSRLLERGGSERADPDLLEREIALGRSMATAHFDSSRHTPEDIAAGIAQLIEERNPAE